MNTKEIVNELTKIEKMNDANLEEIRQSVELLKGKNMEGTAKMFELLIIEDEKVSKEIQVLKTKLLMNT